MTYTIARRRKVAPRPRGMSGFIDDVFQSITGKSPEGECVAQANADVAPFDAKIDDLTRTWNPTGFFAPQDIRDLVSATMSTVTQAQAALDSARSEPNASQDRILSSTNDLARAGGRSLDYLDAARNADAQGLRLVNAPGLKRWVTDTLATASSAMVTASVIACLKPWWVVALSGFQGAFDVVFSLAKRTVGAVIAIGETALKVASDLPQLYDVLKWGLLAGGAYYLWVNVLRRAGQV